MSEGRLHWMKDAEQLQLEQEYNKLIKQKEALTKRVKETSLLNQLQYYVEQHAEGEYVPLDDLASEDNLFKAIQLLKNKKLMETYNTYRLTGLAFVLLDDSRVRFCLDTFYRGQYFEPFYIEIQIQDEKIKILKHTIPFFIPLGDIHQKYEKSSDIKELLAVVSGLLKAFVSRRQQCAQIKENNEGYSVEDLYTTPAFDFVKFTLKFSSDDLPDFEVKLEYSDLNDTLPKDVHLKCSNESSVQQKVLTVNLQANFLTFEIKEAIIESLTQ